MKKGKLTHIDSGGNASMVDISEKAVTRRIARAQASVKVGKEIISEIKDNDLRTKKGSVFQTAVLAGVMASKRTSDLIPLCHPLSLDNCQIHVRVEEESIVLESEVTTTGKTGVEMEALTAVSVAALTVYDMCKAMSHKIIIEQICLLEKTGGKNNFRLNP